MIMLCCHPLKSTWHYHSRLPFFTLIFSIKLSHFCLEAFPIFQMTEMLLLFFCHKTGLAPFPPHRIQSRWPILFKNSKKETLHYFHLSKIPFTHLSFTTNCSDKSLLLQTIVYIYIHMFCPGGWFLCCGCQIWTSLRWHGLQCQPYPTLGYAW